MPKLVSLYKQLSLLLATGLLPLPDTIAMSSCTSADGLGLSFFPQPRARYTILKQHINDRNNEITSRQAIENLK